MAIKKYEGWMLLKTTATHFGNEKTGSSPVLRTIYMYVDGQGEIPIPYIHGNNVRGKLRRLLMREFLEAVGLMPDELGTRLYHTFFTGGALESTEETYATVDLALRRTIKQYLVPLALLGGAIGNQMIPGVLKVGCCFPVCQEYSAYLPPFLKGDSRASLPVRTFTDESFQTRRDDLRAEREEGEQATQMKVDYECFVPGTKFFHWFALEYANEIEESCFGRFMNIFRSSPYVGGKSATGNGEVIFEYQPELPSDEKYLEYIQTNKDKIIEVINKLQETKPAESKPKKKKGAAENAEHSDEQETIL